MIFGLVAYGYGTITAVLVLHLADGVGGAALGLPVFAGAFLLVRVTASRAVDRFGGPVIAVATLTAESAGFVLILMTDAAAAALVGVALVGAGCSLAFPAAVGMTLSRRSRGLFRCRRGRGDVVLGSRGARCGSVRGHPGDRHRHQGRIRRRTRGDECGPGHRSLDFTARRTGGHVTRCTSVLDRSCARTGPQWPIPRDLTSIWATSFPQFHSMLMSRWKVS